MKRYSTATNLRICRLIISSTTRYLQADGHPPESCQQRNPRADNYSPTDLARRWQTKDGKTDRPAFELGATFIYATGMAVPRCNGLETLAVEDVAACQHDHPSRAAEICGELGSRAMGMATASFFATTRMLHWTSSRSRLRSYQRISRPLRISPASRRFHSVTHKSPRSGNTLKPAACYWSIRAAGRQLSRRAFTRICSPRAFPGKEAAILPAIHPMVTGATPGMINLVKPQARPYVFKVMGHTSRVRCSSIRSRRRAGERSRCNQRPARHEHIGNHWIRA